MCRRAVLRSNSSSPGDVIDADRLNLDQLPALIPSPTRSIDGAIHHYLRTPNPRHFYDTSGKNAGKVSKFNIFK
jgi:hypothetical protein